MAKNAFLAQQRKLQEACFREGLRVGRQQIMDMLSLAQVYGEGLADSFLERYETAIEYDYTKGKWKNG